MPNKSKKAPLKRNFISLKSKIQILDRLRKGEKVSHVGKSLNLNEATIRTIQKNEQKIRNAFGAGSSISANVTSRSRPPIIEKMEKSLNIWIDNNSKKGISLNSKIIKQKALTIYNHIKESGEFSTNKHFVASKGWFERFKKRFSIYNMKIKEENTLNNEADKMYSDEFQKIIEEHSLCRKKMPKRTFISRNKKNVPKLKISKDHVTLLLCSNVLEDSEDNSIDENCEVKNFTLKTIWEGLNLAEQLECFFLNADPSIERSRKFKRDLDKCLSPYHKIYKDLLRQSKQQTQITDFFNRTDDTQHLNDAEENPDSKDDFIQDGKRSCSIVLSRDDGNH